MLDTESGYHKDNLRQTLLEAATRLLEEKGSSGFSLREVARAAGVSHTAPYRHFRDKSALLRSVAQEGFAELQAVLEAARHSQVNIEQQLIEAGVGYILQAVRYPERTKLMFSGMLEIDPADVEYVQSCCAAYEELCVIIRAGIEQGIFKDSLDSITLAAWSSVHGMAMLYTMGVNLGITSEEELKKRARILAQQLIDGFKR